MTNVIPNFLKRLLFFIVAQAGSKLFSAKSSGASSSRGTLCAVNVNRVNGDTIHRKESARVSDARA